MRDPAFWQQPINKPLTLHEGKLQVVRNNQVLAEGPGVVRLSWVPEPRIEFAVDIPEENLTDDAWEYLFDPAGSLKLNDGTSFDVKVEGYTDDDVPELCGSMTGRCSFGQAEGLATMQFHLVNFHNPTKDEHDREIQRVVERLDERGIPGPTP